MVAQRIALIGAGNIGATLGEKWAAAGHRLVYGVRNPQSATVTELRARLGDDVELTSIAEALADADVVLLAVTGSAVTELVAEYGHLLDGRVVIDATNQRVKGQAEATGEWGERVTLNSVEVLRKHAPGATVFRAFNHYSWEIFADAVFGDRRADLFYCGPSGDADKVVEELIDAVGVRPVRIGDLDQSEAVDNILALWAALAMFQGKGREKVAFAMLER